MCVCVHVMCTAYTGAFQLVTDAANVMLSSASKPVQITARLEQGAIRPSDSHLQSRIDAEKMLHLPKKPKTFSPHHHMKLFCNICLIVAKDIFN